MTVVSIRCDTCGEVKSKEEMEFTSDGVECDGCRKSEKVQEAKEQDPNDADNGDEKETDSDEEESELDPGDFEQQDALSW